MQKSLFVSFTAACGLIASLIAPPYSLALDFDGDGIADPAAYEVQFDGSANEIAVVYLESSSGNPRRREFGSHKEVPALGDYDGDGITDFMVVGSQDNGTLLWRSRLSSDSSIIQSFEFGLTDDITLSGCLFDNDNKHDAAVVRDGNSLHVRKSSDLGEQTVSLNLEQAEKFSCADLDGDGIAELLAQSSTSGNKAKIAAFRISDGAKLFEAASTKEVRAIFPIDKDGNGTEEAAYVTKGGTKGTLEVVFLSADGSASTGIIPSAAYIVPLGVSAAGQADGLVLGKEGGGNYTLIPSAATLETSIPVALSDTEAPYPEVFSSHVGPVFSKEAGCTIHYEPNDGPQGFLWKPVSDTTGTAVFIFPRELRLRKVRVVKDGVVIDKPPFNGNANGGRDHWKSRRRASTFPKGFTIMGQQKKQTYCYYIAEPGKRID